MESFNSVSRDSSENEPGEEALTPEFKQAFYESWVQAVSSKESKEDFIGSNSEFIDSLERELEQSLEGHLEYLARQQNKELSPLPQLSQEATAQEQLEYMQILVGNIYAVQNGNSAGITPKISKELNGMDCSMSTWTMKHELAKTNIKFAWGMPVEHAVGIVKLADEKLYYADGQNGFIEQVEADIKELPEGGRILQIKNYKEIGDRRKPFFPEFVFVFKNGGVASTMSNIDSMLYKQYVGEISEKQKQVYSPEDIRIVEQLQPYAMRYQDVMKKIESESIREGKSPVNKAIEVLCPEVHQSYDSEQARADSERLRGI